MAKNTKQTSKSVATKASKILRDGRYGKDSKSVAGSALAQTRKGKQSQLSGAASFALFYSAVNLAFSNTIRSDSRTLSILELTLIA